MYNMVDVVLLCRMLSAQYKIKIQPGACSAADGFTAEAWCRQDKDGYVLSVPFSPYMTEEQWRYLRGFIDHECGHVKFTDFQTYMDLQKSVVDDCLRNYKPVASVTFKDFLKDYANMVINILEDVRIERLMGIDFPGSRTNLNKLSEHLFKDCYSVSTMMGNGMVGRLYSLLFMRVRSLINPALEESAQLLYDDMKADVQVDDYAEYTRHLDAVWGIGDIFRQDWSVERAAREFIRIVIEVLEDHTNTAQNINSNRTSSGATDDSPDGDTSNSPDGDTSNSPDGDTDDSPDGDTSNSPDGDTGDSSDDGTASGKKSVAISAKDVSAMASDLYNLQWNDEGNISKRFLDEMQTATDALQSNTQISDEDMTLVDSMFTHTAERLDTLLDRTKMNALADGKCVYITECSHVHALSPEQRGDMDVVMYNLYGRLADVLQTMTLVRHSTGMCGARLDARVLHRASVGDGRIFSKKVQRLRRVTEVALLFDASGSMSMNEYGKSNNNEMAQCMALGCLKALRALPGVKSSLSGFSNGEMFVMSDYGDPVREVILSAVGGTPLGPSLVELTSQFSDGPDVRRIILFFTDGFPDNVGSVTMALDLAKRSGIEVYGIGLQTKAINTFMDSDHSIIVNSINDLAGGMCDMLRKGMVRAYEV
jgi:hypothetical protein